MLQQKPNTRRVIYLAVILGGILFDALSKWLVVRFLKPISSLPLWEGVLHFTYVENRGAAFGMLSGHRWIFMIFSSIAILAIAAYLFRDRSYLSDKDENGAYPPIPFWMGISLAAIVSGGIGNMIDRISLGYVVDFIDFTLINFAVFNVADIFVTVGAFALALCVLLPLIISELKKNKNGSRS